MDHASAGYIKESRKPVTDQLFKVVKQLRAQHAVARGGSALQIISGARIPIIKVSSQSHSNSAATAISQPTTWYCGCPGSCQCCCCHHIHAHLQTSIHSTAYAAMCKYIPSRICAQSLYQGMRQTRTCQCPLQLTTVEGTEVDISLGSDDGIKAAEIIKAKLQEFPLARPLTIVIKAFLKARRLTDVSTGGLGGYALVNMVIAHLQEEAKVSTTTKFVVMQAVSCWYRMQRCVSAFAVPSYVGLLLTSFFCYIRLGSPLMLHAMSYAYTLPLRGSGIRLWGCSLTGKWSGSGPGSAAHGLLQALWQPLQPVHRCSSYWIRWYLPQEKRLPI